MSVETQCVECGDRFEHGWGDDRDTCNRCEPGNPWNDRDLRKNERLSVTEMMDVVVTEEDVLVDPDRVGGLLMDEDTLVDTKTLGNDVIGGI